MWDKSQEVKFFTEARKFASPEQLFYQSDDGRYYAYWPKSYKGKTGTLQSRNSLIGNFTETWCANLMRDFAEERGFHVVQDAVCKEIGLTRQSPADIAICKINKVDQRPSDIVAIFEVKMSVVWNWELKITDNEEKLICLGDYKTHRGTPGMLRSDSMLKAIGKSINIRVYGSGSASIPIIILGNTPISKSYYDKVDRLRKNGIIQGFWSLNPNPLDNNGENIKHTIGKGFFRFDSRNDFFTKLNDLLEDDLEFFSSMKRKKELGRIIEIANKEASYEAKAEMFLSLIRGD